MIGAPLWSKNEKMAPTTLIRASTRTTMTLRFSKKITQPACSACGVDFKPRQGLALNACGAYIHNNKKLCLATTDAPKNYIQFSKKIQQTTCSKCQQPFKISEKLVESNSEYHHHRDCVAKSKVVSEGPMMIFTKNVSQKICAVCDEEFKPMQGLILVDGMYFHKNEKICVPNCSRRCSFIST